MKLHSALCLQAKQCRVQPATPGRRVGPGPGLAAVALAIEIRIQGFVHCQQKSTNRDRTINAVCTVDRRHADEGEDLAAYLIRHGWALALPEAPFEYQALEKIARQQSAGVWGFTVDGIRRRPR